MAPIVAMFAKAGESLKKPHVLLAIPGFPTIKIAKGKNGDLTVAEKTFGGAFYGWLRPDGTYLPFKAQASAGAISMALMTFASDPARVAAEYGKATHHCCFCGLELTKGRSIEVGYGPDCADHYGLPY